ncbi:hypothetical protein FRB99_001297 [Tulasnella sp. 403]|nr:hypothetical protein FRB99_001297 [Tulasnella sp. 403]
MPSLFHVLRTTFLVLFILLNATICAAAALNISMSGSASALRPVDAYLLFLSSSSIVFIFSVILVDILRRGALTSKVWFECVWLSLTWLMNLCGAAATTALSPAAPCSFEARSSCTVAHVLIGVTWTTTLFVLAQLVLILVSAIYYSKRHPDVWTSGVCDFQWFNGGGSGKSTAIPSVPPSPTFVARQPPAEPSNPVAHLERMAQNWQPTTARPSQPVVPAITVIPAPRPAATTEPQPLTYAYAPDIAPSRAPVHYNATAVVSVGVLPGRRPSKKVPAVAPAPSLYPHSVQTALSTTPRQTEPPSQPAPLSAISHSSSRTHAVVPITNEPLPIQGWPRVNPQDPFRKDKSSATPVVASRQIQAVTLAAPSPAPAIPASETSRRSSRGHRHRPPPLDLSAASPARFR